MDNIIWTETKIDIMSGMVRMPFDPNAQPWLNARIYLAACGDDAIDFVGVRWQKLVLEGRTEEAAAMLAVLHAIITLGPSRGVGEPIH